MKSTAIVECKYTEYYDNPTIIVSFFVRRTDFFFTNLFIAFSRNGNPPFLIYNKVGGIPEEPELFFAFVDNESSTDSLSVAVVVDRDNVRTGNYRNRKCGTRRS